MDCKISLDKDSQEVTGTSNVNATITLTTKKTISNIKSVCYGITLKANIYTQEDSSGSWASTVPFGPSASSMSKIGHMKDELVLVQKDLLHEVSHDSPLYNTNRNHWILAPQPPFKQRIQIQFPTTLMGIPLPSSQIVYVNTQPQPGGGAVYYLYVKVVYGGGLFSKSKVLMYRHALVYTGGIKAPALGYFMQSIEREFGEKHPQPQLIDVETGRCNGQIDLANPQNSASKFIRYNGNQRVIMRHLQLISSLKAPDAVDPFMSLMTQLDLDLSFILSDVSFPRDFAQGPLDTGASTGLGLLQLRTLTIEVTQTTHPYLKGCKAVAENMSVIDMLDCAYHPLHWMGTFHLEGKALADYFGDRSLVEFLVDEPEDKPQKKPHKNHNVQEVGHGSFQLTLEVIDCNNSVTFPFICRW